MVSVAVLTPIVLLGSLSSLVNAGADCNSALLSNFTAVTSTYSAPFAINTSCIFYTTFSDIFPTGTRVVNSTVNATAVAFSTPTQAANFTVSGTAVAFSTPTQAANFTVSGTAVAFSTRTQAANATVTATEVASTVYFNGNPVNVTITASVYPTAGNFVTYLPASYHPSLTTVLPNCVSLATSVVNATILPSSTSTAVTNASAQDDLADGKTKPNSAVSNLTPAVVAGSTAGLAAISGLLLL